MRSRALLNLVLLVLVLGLSAVVILKPGKEAPEAPPRLTDIDSAAIAKLRIEHRDPDRGPVELVKRDGRWRMTLPFDVAANEFRVVSLLGVANTESHGAFPADQRDLAQFDLAAPPVVLYLNDRRLAFGDTEPLHGRRYVLVDGAVHLIADQTYYYLTARAPSFVDTALLESGTEAVLIEILPEPNRADEEADDKDRDGSAALAVDALRLEKQESGWKVVPERPEIGADALGAFADAWRGAQALSVGVGDEGGATLASAAVHLRGAAEPVWFDVAEQDHELVFARRDLGLQYRLARGAGERLLSLKGVEDTSAPSEDEQHVPTALRGDN